MRTFFLVFHLIVAVAMISVILLQRSEGGGLGFGNSTMGGAMTARGTANFLTRLTAVLAAVFIGMNLLLSILAHQETKQRILAPVMHSEQKIQEKTVEETPIQKESKEKASKASKNSQIAPGENTPKKTNKPS